MVYVNTLMVQDILVDDDWATHLTDADRRGLTPLFWTRVAPYGHYSFVLPDLAGGCRPLRNPDEAPHA